ncbi:MAG TPA: hypothetical protein VFO01_14175 [Trebonia sp.]|nr:hypothetical protein [Trebonia sp.]
MPAAVRAEADAHSGAWIGDRARADVQVADREDPLPFHLGGGRLQFGVAALRWSERGGCSARPAVPVGEDHPP